MLCGKRYSNAFITAFISLFTFSQVYQHVLFDKITPWSVRQEETRWVASSPSWIERKSCRWLGLCGLSHMRKSGWTKIKPVTAGVIDQTEGRSRHLFSDSSAIRSSKFWTSGEEDPANWSAEERQKREIPEYVLEYAPLIHLYSGEEYWPCDIADHLVHTTPHLNYTPVQAESNHPNLTNLADLNEWGFSVYLQSDDNVEEHPDWLGGEANIPAAPGDSDEDEEEYFPGVKNSDKSIDHHDESESWYDVGIGSLRELGGDREDPTAIKAPSRPKKWAYHHELRSPGSDSRRGGRSDAPAILVVVPKPNGVVDAFWFFFYCFNLGNTVFGVRCGNHVGDWEHTLIRFQHGKPKAVFFSEHSFGDAYSFEALEKIGKRPVGYSATGTHAMYATPGDHPYVLPYGILKDRTDRGPLWDPRQNFHAYTYDYINNDIRSSNYTPKAPSNWFNFIGHWGDKFYPLNDPRQYRIFGQYHYVNGPFGPRFKNLGRKKVCQGNRECTIKHWIGDTNSRVKRWENVGEGEGSDENAIQE